MRIRDHGAGEVTLDDDGQAQIHYSLTDEIDVANFRQGIDKLVRLLVESGARKVIPMGNQPSWQDGEDLDEYLAELSRVPLEFGGVTMLSAHQMSSCRMGSDPHTSVADHRGQLHDTPGVWIGDASGFPTASGTNPIVSVFALAHRTAGFIAADHAERAAPTTVAATTTD